MSTVARSQAPVGSIGSATALSEEQAEYGGDPVDRARFGLYLARFRAEWRDAAAR